MTYNYEALYQAAVKINNHCTKFGGRLASVTCVYDQIMRAFAHPATESVTYAVFFNAPVSKSGEVTVYRNGSVEMQIQKP